MTNEVRKALVLARPEDAPAFERKLRARGYEVDTITSASQVESLKDYEIVCIGGSVCSPTDAVEPIEALATSARTRAPRLRRRA